MPRIYANAESVETIATQLIPVFHPHLASARINYVTVDKAGMKGGRPVLGKASRVTGVHEYLLELDFLIVVAADQWNELSSEQRTALVDHLLEHCFGEEDEQTGELKWSVREPEVQEFVTILRRRGAWTTDLANFVSVAKTVDLDTIIEELAEEAVTTTVE